MEYLSIELIQKNSKNTVLSTIYRSPDGDFKAFNFFLKDIYSISLKSNKRFYPTDDFNLKAVDHSSVPNCRGGRGQIAHFGKKTPQVHLIIIKE